MSIIAIVSSRKKIFEFFTKTPHAKCKHQMQAESSCRFQQTIEIVSAPLAGERIISGYAKNPASRHNQP